VLELLRRRTAAATLAAASVVSVAPATQLVTEPATAATTRVVGGDVSWPNCPKGMGIPSRRSEGKPMPTADAKYVVIGLTNGPGFYPNPCLGSQVKWAKNHHMWTAAYAMTTYPTAARIRQHGTTGPHTHKYLYGKLWNTGYAQAQFNVASMKRVALTSPMVWVDVEPYPVAPWSSSRADNAAVVEGVVKGYQDAGYRVGFYSTQSLWAGVVGNLRFGYPEWRTAGQTSMSSALYKCDHYPIQGGRAVMAQWWDSQRDHGVMCPGYGTASTMKRYFHKY
jgi:hypothetical protein